MFESNKDLVRRVMDAAWNQGDLSLLDRALAPGYAFRHPNFPEPISGPDGYRRFVQAYRFAFPDLHIVINEMVAEGDLVAYRWTAAGTHLNELRTGALVAPPSRHQVIWSGITLTTVRDGLIIDDLMYSDTLGLRMQLGWILERREVHA